jgi:hypothetical protein
MYVSRISLCRSHASLIVSPFVFARHMKGDIASSRRIGCHEGDLSSTSTQINVSIIPSSPRDLALAVAFPSAAARVHPTYLSSCALKAVT